MSKIVIIGAGFVGSTTAYALMLGGTAQEIVLIDKKKEKAHGEAMDLSHGASFIKPVHIYAGEYEDCKNADIIIITAGAPQEPGQRRMDLVQVNTGVIKEILSNILEHNADAIFIVVTNPVDIMSYVVWKISSLPHSRIIGSGTVLDTSRFRHLLSARCNIDPRNIHAYVIGEHGDSEVPLWSTANVAGIPLTAFCETCANVCSSQKREELMEKVRDSAYEIISEKGATYYAIALALRRICESILRDEHSVLTVSSLIDGNYGVKDIYLSVPCVLGKNGVENIIPFELNDEEKRGFIRSAEVVKSSIPINISKSFARYS
jgi:L-lactate dehydrogenase